MEEIKKLFAAHRPAVDFVSLRYHREHDHQISVRQNILEPLATSFDEGVMVTVHHQGGTGYAATCDLSGAGIKAAFSEAQQWAVRDSRITVTDFSKLEMPHPQGEFRSPVQQSWDDVPLKDKLDFLQSVSKKLKNHESIVDWSADLWHSRSERLYLTGDGGEVFQDFDRLVPMMRVQQIPFTIQLVLERSQLVVVT